MNLRTFLSHCQFYTTVLVCFDKICIGIDSAYCLLHSDRSCIVTRLDCDVDYFTVDGTGIIVCVLSA